MKKLLLIMLVFSTVFSFGKCCKNKKKCCHKSACCAQKSALSPDEAWLKYDETKCANPWQFNWFAAPTDEQLAGAVKGELQGKSINILEIRTSRDKDAVSCDACTCPNGFHYFVRVNKTELSKLKELKFFEVTEVPEVKDNKK